MVDYNKNKARLLYVGTHFIVFHFDKDYLFNKGAFIKFDSSFESSLSLDSIGKEEHILILMRSYVNHRLEYVEEDNSLTVDDYYYYHSLNTRGSKEVLETVSGIKSLTIGGILQRLDTVWQLNNGMPYEIRVDIVNKLVPVSSITNRYHNSFYVRELFSTFEKHWNNSKINYKASWFFSDVVEYLSRDYGKEYIPRLFLYYRTTGINYKSIHELDRLFERYKHVYFYESYTNCSLSINEIRKYIKDLSNTILDIDFSVWTSFKMDYIVDKSLSNGDFIDGFDSIFSVSYMQLLVFNRLEMEIDTNFAIINAAEILVSRIGTSINKNFMAAFLYYASKELDSHSTLIQYEGSDAYTVESVLDFFTILGIPVGVSEKYKNYGVILRKDKFKELLPYFKYAFAFVLVGNKYVYSSFDIDIKRMKIRLSSDCAYVSFAYTLDT